MGWKSALILESPGGCTPWQQHSSAPKGDCPARESHLGAPSACPPVYPATGRRALPPVRRTQAAGPTAGRWRSPGVGVLVVTSVVEQLHGRLRGEGEALPAAACGQWALARQRLRAGAEGRGWRSLQEEEGVACSRGRDNTGCGDVGLPTRDPAFISEHRPCCPPQTPPLQSWTTPTHTHCL